LGSVFAQPLADKLGEEARVVRRGTADPLNVKVEAALGQRLCRGQLSCGPVNELHIPIIGLPEASLKPARISDT